MNSKLEPQSRLTQMHGVKALLTILQTREGRKGREVFKVNIGAGGTAPDLGV